MCKLFHLFCRNRSDGPVSKSYRLVTSLRQTLRQQVWFLSQQVFRNQAFNGLRHDGSLLYEDLH